MQDLQQKISDGVTLLTNQQIWGDDLGNGRLVVMDTYGTKTGMSDLAIVLGGDLSTLKTIDGQLGGHVWSASPHLGHYVKTVSKHGSQDFDHPISKHVGARPALPSSVTSSIKISSDLSAEALAKGEARPGKPIKDTYMGDVRWSDVVEYGEYPQTVAFADESPENAKKHTDELEAAYKSDTLQKTGKRYTFDAGKYHNYETTKEYYKRPFEAKKFAEYKHKGKRYIRVVARTIIGAELSNGDSPANGEACWIEVKPIEWLVEPAKCMYYSKENPEGVEIDNPNAGIWVARQALFSGMQLDRNEYYNGNFADTDMKKYLKNHFARDMMPSQSIGLQEQSGNSTSADETETSSVDEKQSACMSKTPPTATSKKRSVSAKAKQTASVDETQSVSMSETKPTDVNLEETKVSPTVKREIAQFCEENKDRIESEKFTQVQDITSPDAVLGNSVIVAGHGVGKVNIPGGL